MGQPVTTLFLFLSFLLNTVLLCLVSQNSTRPPLKLSNVERITNFQILVLFGCLLAISLVCSIGQTIWKYQYGNDAWYMDLNCKSPSGDRWAPYSTYFVSLVHISLLLLSFYFTSLVKLLVCVVLSLFLPFYFKFSYFSLVTLPELNYVVHYKWNMWQCGN